MLTSAMPRPRLLIVKLADLGDAVLVTAAVDAAKEHLPGWEVDLLLGTAGAPVFAGDGRVRRVWGFDRALLEGRRAFTPRSLLAWGRLLWALRRERYDAVVVAHHLTTLLGALKLLSVTVATGAQVRVGLDNGRGRGWLNRRLADGGFGAVCEGVYWVWLVGVLARGGGGGPGPAAITGAYGKAWGEACVDGRIRLRRTAGEGGAGEVRGRLSLRVDPAAMERAERLLGGGVERPLVAMHHGLGGWIPSRAWRAEGYARVTELLRERVGGSVVLVGGPEERAAAEEVARLSRAPVRVVAGETDVPTLVALLASCDAYLGPDSGPTQIAGALGIPVVSLWGPTNERAWGPCPEIGSGPAACLRAPDHPRPWVYVGHRMGDPRRPPDLGSLDPERVAEAVVRGLRTED